MAWKFPLLAIFIMTTGISCYVGPDFNSWDFETIEEASQRVGIELFIVPNEEWNNYSVIQGLEDGYYRIYECIWRNGSKEWVIYRRIGGSYSWYRFSGPEFRRWDYNTEAEASQKVDRNLSLIPNSQWNINNFILNLTDGCNYRVYECFWRKRSEEWVICKKEGDNYYWYRFLKPAAAP